MLCFALLFEFGTPRRVPIPTYDPDRLEVSPVLDMADLSWWHG
jgi:hypothetical protein